MKTKILSGLVILALALTIPYGAEASTRAIADTYTMDGITYYNVNSSNFNSDKRFYVDVVSAKHSALGGRSLGDLWLMAAAGMGKEYVPTGLGRVNLDYIDRLKEALLTGKLPDEYKYIYTYSYSAPEWKNYEGGYVETSATIKSLLSAGLGNVKYTVRFSDFTVGALLPADEGLYVHSTTETGSVKNIEASTVKNDTGSTITASQNESRTVSETLSSTVNHSSTYSFTEGLKVGAEASSFGIYKMSVEMSAQFTQAFTDGWSKSEAKTASKTTGSSVSVTLPAYTNVMIKQGEAETTTTTKYNCPVIIGYKVSIYIQPDIFLRYLTFGSSNSNARKDLNHRAFEEGSKTYDSQQIDWENILSDSDFKDAIQKITTHAPMSGSGATLVYTTHTTYSEVAGLAPLYPLARVALENNTLSFIDKNNVATMKAGDYSYVDYLNLNGYNSRNAAYYGFDKSKGYWKVVDANMREVSGSDAPVVLTKDAATGYTQFKAVKPGKCYLKYFINENAYPTGIGSNTYTKNSAIQPAMLEINVADEEVRYEITGSYTGIVNSQPESIEGDDKLIVSAYNTEDIEVDREYIWQKQEADKRGIKLDDKGRVTLTKKGPFHVRVKDKNMKIYSDWVLITAEGLGDDTEEQESETPTEYAEEGTTFMISGKYVGGVSNDAESIEGLGRLSVAAYEPTGMEQNVLYSWEARDDSDGMTLTDDGQVSFTKAGTYYARVKSGQVYSDWIELKVNEKAPARFTHAPTSTGNSYTGKAVDLLAVDASSEGGTVVYGLGSDDVTPPTSYSSERPKAVEAGTYYVWCKVLGDADHENSEAICIIATIEGDSDEEPDDGNEDNTSDNPGSSGGGCNVSALGLGLMAAALILGRKVR